MMQGASGEPPPSLPFPKMKKLKRNLIESKIQSYSLITQQNWIILKRKTLPDGHANSFISFIYLQPILELLGRIVDDVDRLEQHLNLFDTNNAVSSMAIRQLERGDFHQENGKVKASVKTVSIFKKQKTPCTIYIYTD